jgi:putative FmdB family regulatory protein
MLRVFDFYCPKGHTSELFVSVDTDETKCPQCEKTAYRIISAPNVKLEGWSGSFPGAAMKWEKKHREKMIQEQKRNND